jgi:hypothetical protein
MSRCDRYLGLGSERRYVAKKPLRRSKARYLRYLPDRFRENSRARNFPRGGARGSRLAPRFFFYSLPNKGKGGKGGKESASRRGETFSRTSPDLPGLWARSSGGQTTTSSSGEEQHRAANRSVRRGPRAARQGIEALGPATTLPFCVLPNLLRASLPRCDAYPARRSYPCACQYYLRERGVRKCFCIADRRPPPSLRNPKHPFFGLG